MKVVYMGTPEFAVGPLVAVHAAGHDVVMVVSQPDRPKGRGRKLTRCPVAEKAAELGIPVFQPVKVRLPEAVDQIREAAPDIIIVAAYGQILPKSLLDIPRLGCINIHASLLPKLRGAAPINWAIIRGDDKTGVTLMQMDPGMDTGDILVMEEEPVLPDDTAGSLTTKMSALGAGMIDRYLPDIEAGRLVPLRQDSDNATMAPLLKKETGHIDWTSASVVIERFVRGMAPWPGAYTSINGETMRVWRAEVKPQGEPAEPGTIVGVGKDGIAVATADGVLNITELQPEGGRRMSVRDYLAGHKIPTGGKLV